MSLLEKIQGIVSEQLDVSQDQVVPEASFVDDLGADSLDLTELIMAMEDEFGLEIDDDKAQQLRTVQDVISFVEANS
ncbi:MAG: acyl carrier protein [Desulfohalobiaceae bacterium]